MRTFRSSANAVWVVSFALIGLVLALAWLPLHHLGQYGARNSDNATPILQGFEVLRGNLTLHGWVLPQDTFLTSEVPFYAIAVAWHGIAPDLIYAVPSAVYLACAMLAAWTASRGFDPIPGSVGAGATVLLLLAVPALWGYAVLVPGIAHIGALWPALAAFNLVAAGQRQALRAAGAGALIAITSLGDPLVVVIGAAPLLVLGFVELARRDGGWPALAGALGIAGFEAGEMALSTLGGLHLLKVPVTLVLTHPRSHVLQAISNASGLLQPSGPGGAGASLAVIAFWLLLAAAVVVATRRAMGRQGAGARLDVLLLLGVMLGFAAYALTDRSTIPLTARYLIPSAVMATIVIGRLGAVATERSAWFALPALAVIVMVAAVRLAGVVGTLQQPASPPTGVRPVEAYLLANGHHRGYAPYWDGNYTTVDSGNRLQVRPLIADGMRLKPMRWSVSDSWYSPGAEADGADFVFFKDADSAAASSAAGDFGIYLATAAATFGPPEQVVHVAGYTILTWSHDISTQVPW